MKRICTLLVALGLAYSSYADEKIKVWTSEGEYVSFDLENDDAMVSVDSYGSLVVTSSKASVIFPRKTYKKITFDGVKDKTGIEDTRAVSKASFHVADSRIMVEGVEALTTITIHDMAGKLVEQGLTDANGTWRSTALQQGIYVISTKNVSFKVMISK